MIYLFRRIRATAAYKSGFVSADPAIDGEKLTRDWLRNIYHSADDQSDQNSTTPATPLSGHEPRPGRSYR